ncbi:hypothetical protein [uncultured Lentibacter sp.]|uniref:hypothetical protein n=1 Tax=uncultured Lentibacter sp. TaxID=1659309 RepID=UPI002638128D|nr:hypothetical protein [uncultured Lentibacter sp.]MCW1955588.1 hypothetical protein [Roseobacter sp.]
MLPTIKHFFKRDDGAVTVDWVVLTAAVVGLLAAGYGMMRQGTADLADGTSDYMISKDAGQF